LMIKGLQQRETQRDKRLDDMAKEQVLAAAVIMDGSDMPALLLLLFSYNRRPSSTTESPRIKSVATCSCKRARRA
jgi:hypothetical protein